MLRPVLGCRWIEQGRGPVPMEFHKLYVTLDDAQIVAAIENLVEQKRAGAELEEGNRDPLISDFIDSELERLRALLFEREPLRDVGMLDELLRSAIGINLE